MTDSQPKNRNDSKKKKKKGVQGVLRHPPPLVFFKFAHAQLITAVSMDRRCTG